MDVPLLYTSCCTFRETATDAVPLPGGGGAERPNPALGQRFVSPQLLPRAVSAAIYRDGGPTG